MTADNAIFIPPYKADDQDVVVELNNRFGAEAFVAQETRTGMHSETKSEDSKFKTANDLADAVFERFQTRDIFEITEKAGLKIIYRQWFPVTLGELDWQTKTICVNESAGIDGKTIVAHELGHYFLREFDSFFAAAADEEKFCDEFASRLLING